MSSSRTLSSSPGHTTAASSSPGRTIAALSLIAAPVVMAASEMLRFRVEGGTYTGTEEHLARVAANAGLWDIMTVLNMVAVILFVPAILGLVHLVRDGAPVLAHIGGGLALVGTLGAAGHNVFAFVFDGAMAQVAAREHMVELSAELEERTTFLVVLLMFVVGFVLGLLLLGVGLYRSHTAPRFAGAAIVLGMLVFANAGTSLSMTLVSSALLTVGMGAAGLRLFSGGTASREVTDATVERGPAPRS